MHEGTPGKPPISPYARPALAAKTRLQTDRLSNEQILLYPEGIVQINPTGVAIVELCDGQHTFQQIVEILAERYQTTATEIQEDIEMFLTHLYNESLLE